MANSSSFTINIKAVADMQDVVSNVKSIQDALGKLKLPDNLKASFKQTFGNLEKELDNYQKIMASGFKSKGDANALTKSGNNILRLYDDIVKKMNQIDDSTLRKAFEDLGAKEVEKLRSELSNLENDLKTKISTKNTIDFTQAKTQLKSFTSDFKDANNQINASFKTISNSTINTFFKNIDLGRLDLAEQNLQKIEQTAKELGNSNLTAWAADLREKFDALKDDSGIKSTIESINELKQNLTNASADALQNLINGFKDGTISAEQFGQQLQQIVTETNQWGQVQAQTNKEIDQVKSRIQYFLGLNNAINLVKRAIRSAVETIKDLDKAMTETAVVTDFTVSDMWKQLPEYTKRANELGVTTQQAYESATLFYQQGLNTEQAAALSTETLKMARIAGLDAAEATDRMTNALRGFNMELDAQSAQRVDDVYSQLAAHTASNVDEISTAMTKVASLAHNANMEFETTAAFLAQIIETTRESAETAGTALKTVVARFSEVKKLYSEDQLKGTDEEGQVIDVNRIGVALRTAGIDLNKYFLGEVGLDDIFMELASKWDTLSSVQQRYIATQAAGSRQQSRFIALMQNYARTQELVGMAYEANGASAKQFAKTQESLQSKLARLKNAWNEFLMGLTNNAVVKTAVDLLTDILNLVNKLTSAFGDGVGSILKWGAALAGLMGARSLFSDKGLATKAIGALFQNTIFSKFLGKGEISEVTTQPLGGTLLNGVTNVGKGIWGGAQKLGTRATFLPGILGKATGGLATGIQGAAAAHGLSAGASSGLAAGLTGVASALGVVAVAVGAAIAAYQLWLNFSPEGKLKKAKKEAEKLNKQAEESQNELKALTSLEDTYKEKTAEVENATNAKDRAAAVKERNQAVLDAIEQDGTLAKYVVTEVVDNEIQITIDEDALANAIKNVSETTENAVRQSEFGNAIVDLRQADVWEKNLRVLWANTTLDAGSVDTFGWQLEDYLNSILANQSITAEEQTQAAKLYQDIINTRGKAQQQASITYAKQLQGLTKDTDLINALIPALSEAFLQTEKQLTGEELQSLLGLGKSNLTPLLEAYSGKGQVAEISLDHVNLDSDALFDALGLSTDLLQQFANILGVSIEEVKTQIRTQAKANKAIRQNRQANIFEQALQSGHGISVDFFKEIKNLDTSRLNVVSDIVTQAVSSISDETLSKLLDELPTLDMGSLEELQSFFKDFNLDNPIQALDQLNNKLATVDKNSTFGQILTDIQNTNKALFDSGNLVQTFFLSDAYSSLSDSVDGFIKENGKITTKNIEDLADECSDLKKIIDNNVASAQGLAEALTLLQNGEAPIEGITSALMAALSAGESFDTLLGKVQDWIENFDEGPDMTEGTEHIIDVLGKAQEYVSDWQFGNKPLENIYNHIFGPDAYADYMSKNWGNKTFDQIEKDLTENIERVNKLAEDEGRGALDVLASQNKVQKIGDTYTWDLSQYKNVSEAITDVANSLNIGEDAARAFIEAWGSHMYDLGRDWDNFNLKDQLIAFNEEAQKASVTTEAELKTLGNSIGLTVEQLQVKFKEFGIDIPVTVNWQNEKGQNLTGQDLIKQFNDAIDATTNLVKTPGGPYGSDWHYEEVTDYSNFVKDFQHSFDNVVGPNGELQQGIDAIDFSALQSHLTESFKMTPAQAAEVADNIAQSVDGKFAQTIKVPIAAEDGSIQMLEKTIVADSAEGLAAGINAELEAADVALVAQKIANLDVSSIGTNIGDALTTGGTVGAANIQASIDGLDTNVLVLITYQETNSPPPLATGGTVTLHSTRATGGIIGSYAKGSENFHVQPGTALTGEEGPELVWNKNGGYAYITGQDGPEFQNLQPGDRIFNADETKKILHNSAATGGIIDSYASGGWKSGDSKKSGGGSGSSDKDEDDEWKNEIDWLYNVVQNIEELERQQNILQEKYDDLLTDQTKTGQDLYKMLIQQLGNLYAQLDHQTYALEKREQEMREFMDTTNDKDEYLWYNWEDRTIEIDWDKIDQITDEDEYNHVKELIDHAEDIQDKMDDAEDAIIDINNSIQELENIWRDTFTDFEDRVLKAIIKMYQTVIDNYSELNDTLNDSNSAILDAINKEISLQRQIRDNTKTEEEIANDEAQLAYLRRDTTGGNDLAALQLQKQLDDQRQNYEDNLVDQAVQRLQDDNEAAAAQREKQIEIMQAQLDYQSENGEFNAYIRDLMDTAIDGDGHLATDSDLYKLLAEQENLDAMTKVGKEVWEEELNGTFKEVVAFLLKENGEAEGTYFTAVTAAFENLSGEFDKFYHGSYSQGTAHGGSSSSSGSSNGSSSTNSTYTPQGRSKIDWTKADAEALNKAIIAREDIEDQYWNTTTDPTKTAAYKAADQKVKELEKKQKNAKNPSKESQKVKILTHYATGGLADTTGIAWLDGTKSEPEYVLNAKQTQAFLKLADVLPAAISNTGSSIANTFGATTNNIVINVDKIDSDYSVDQMVARVKESLFESGSYRNNNVLNFLR